MRTDQSKLVQDAVLHAPSHDTYARRLPIPPDRQGWRARIALAELRLRENNPAAAHAILVSVLDGD
jgi:hypothetical protein